MTGGRVVMIPAPIIRRALTRYRAIIDALGNAKDSDDFEQILCGIDKRTCSLAEIALDEWVVKACAKESLGAGRELIFKRLGDLRTEAEEISCVTWADIECLFAELATYSCPSSPYSHISARWT